MVQPLAVVIEAADLKKLEAGIMVQLELSALTLNTISDPQQPSKYINSIGTMVLIVKLILP